MAAEPGFTSAPDRLEIVLDFDHLARMRAAEAARSLAGG
jgi:hypothetical protein